MFRNIIYRPSSIVDRIDADVWLGQNGFEAQVSMDIERQDFEQFMSTLIQMLESNGRYAQLNPEGDRFRILFELQSNGHVVVNAEMKDLMYMSSLKVKAISDQTLCAELAKELSDLLSEFPRTVH
jgi:hypothetical protein